jgi:virginiamycin A acetyltransferase
MRESLKLLAHALATVTVVPALLSYRLRTLAIGPDRALEGSTQALSLVPGLVGQYLRRAFLCQVLDACHRSVTVEFGTLFSAAGSRLGERVYVGPGCHLGLVDLGADVLIGAGVHIPSGGRAHATSDTNVPIRDQPFVRTRIRVGHGSWIGSAAVVMADVGHDSIVGSGAVVTKPVPDRVVAAGVPARVLKARDAGHSPR